MVAASSKRSTEMSMPRKLTWFCGKIGLTRTHLRADLIGHDGGQETHEPDGGDRLGHGPVVAQRAEDEQVGQGAQDGLRWPA